MSADETQYFYALTPDRILDAVDRVGFRTTGRCQALNSMENRVCAVEVEDDGAQTSRTIIVKFYRPGRWTREQILEEHAFLADLSAAEIAVAAPLRAANGETLHGEAVSGIHYALFPRVGGRVPDEPDAEDLEQIGRLIARVHNVGAQRPTVHRLRLDVATFGRANLAYLLETGRLPAGIRPRYEQVVQRISALAEPLFAAVGYQRIHGDCHLGNILRSPDGYILVDFDDMVCGPGVQDLWLLCGASDHDGRRRLERLVGGYEQMRRFDRRELALIEPLRALRIVHFSAWIARRWSDPAFPRVFPDYGTQHYWSEELEALSEILSRMEDAQWSQA